MIKIFYPEKVIYLVNNREGLKPNKDNAFHEVNLFTEIQTLYTRFIENKKLKEIYFFNQDEKLLFALFSGLFKLIDAAGGLVKNKKNQWLFIYRNNKWDLPKGKVEKNEAIADAAIREVEEECGIRGLSIVKQLAPTFHIYFQDNQLILKRTYWFEMLCTDESPLIPQQEEGITDVKWLDKEALKKVRMNTFESVKDVIQLL